MDTLTIVSPARALFQDGGRRYGRVRKFLVKVLVCCLISEAIPFIRTKITFLVVEVVVSLDESPCAPFFKDTNSDDLFVNAGCTKRKTRVLITHVTHYEPCVGLDNDLQKSCSRKKIENFQNCSR